MTQLVVLDAVHFGHMTGGDAALQQEIIGLFRAQVADWGRMLSPNQPVAVWRGAAHTVKGSAKGIGLWVLAAACERAEDSAGGDNVGAALSDVHAALAEAMAALDRFSGDDTAP